jgi:hypothetical protein
MNSIVKKAEKALTFFIEGKRIYSEDTFVYLNEKAPEELRQAVKNAHGDSFPNDFVYGTFVDLLQKVTEYDDQRHNIEDIRHEIVESECDIYTHDLTEWLADDINNVGYLTEVMEEGGANDGFQLLSQAQYKAIDEVMEHVISYLTSK